MRSLKLVSILAAVAVPLASAHAITFSNIFIDGVSASGTAFGSNGISFSVPNNFLVGVGTKTLKIQYRVDATAGNELSSFGVFPVGITKLGSVAFSVDHTNGGTQTYNYSQTGGASATSLTSVPTIALAPRASFYDVTTMVTLTGNAATSVNKLTIYSVSYTEAVPEPASMMAMTIGVGTLFARRRKGKKS